jgi:hypothetical protein
MLLALVVVLLAIAPSAHAVDRQAAAEKALAALGTESSDAPVIVFGLRRTLAPGTVLAQAGPRGRAVAASGDTAFARRRARRVKRAGVQLRRPATVMRVGSERAWLFYEDRGPHQAFEHAGRVVLVGARTGTVRVSSTLRWVPLVGGRVPAFFRSVSGYESKRFRVFSRPWPVPRAESRARARAAGDTSARQQIADALAAERSCALRVSDTLGDFFDYGRVDQTRARLGLFLEGLEALNAGFVSRRYTTKGARTPIEAAQALIDAGCRDLLIYVAGAAPRTGAAGIVAGMRVAGGVLEWHLLTGDALEGLTKRNRNVGFKFVLDAPYSRVNAQLIDEPNTILLISSGGPDESSFTFLPEMLGPDGVQGNPDNPEQLLEFTNALLSGLEAFAGNGGEIGQWRANASGTSMMAWMFARALGLSPAGTFVAPIDLIKLPGVTPMPPPPPPPGAPSPINHAPVPTTAAQPTQEDTPKAITLTATDPDGDPLTFTVTDLPDHGTLSGTPPHLTYTPAQDFNGTDSFTYTVSDNRGATAEQTVTIPVTPDNDAAAVVASAGGPLATFVEDGAAVVVDSGLTISDPDSTQLEGATVEIVGGEQSGDQLLFTNQSGITGSYADGLLTLSGVATVTQYRDALRSVEFDTTSQAPGLSRTIEFRAEDGDEAGVPATRDVTVEPVNDAPALSVPGAQSTNEDTALVFAPLASNAITVADPDAGADAIDVDLSVVDGTLTLGGTTGLASSSGDGTGAVSLSGTVSAVNAALSGLSYAPGANFSGSDTLLVDVDDLGHDGTGGALTDSDSVAVTVSAVNDGPVNTVPGAQSVAEDATLTLTSALSVADVDAGAGLIRTTLSVDDGTLDVAATGGTLTGDGTDTVQVDGTVAQVNAALAAVDYAPDADFNGADSLQVATTDLGNTGSGGALTDTDTVAITVSAVNDAPQLSVPGAQTVDEDASETFAGGTLVSVSDVDAGGDAVRVVLGATDGVLTLSGTTGLTFTDGTSDGTDSLKFEGTVAAVNAALDGMTYTGDANFNGADTLAIDVSDLGHTGSGGALTDSDSVALTVSAVNDGPVNTVPGAQSVAEDATLTLTSALSVADVDAGAGAIRTTLSVADGTLDVAATGGTLTGDGTDTVQVDGTVAQVNAALAAVDYAPDADFNGADSLQVATTDLGNTGSGGALTDTDTVAITVSAVNDAPVNVLPSTAALNEDATFTFTAADAAGVSDVDAGPADDLEVTLDVDHGTLDLDGTTGLTFTTGDGTGDATMTFRGTEAELADALDGLVYAPAADYDAGDTLTMTTSDLGSTGSGGAQTDTDTTAISVNAINDAPVNTVPGAESAIENTALVLGTVSVADVDDTSLEMTLDVDHGTLTLPTTTGLTFTTGDGTGDATMVFSGAQSALNAALDGVTYTPTTGYNGADTLTVTSDDGALTDTDTVAIDVDALNIAPVNTVPGAQSVDEDATKTFSLANSNLISVADADAGTDDVEVALGVTEGVLSLSGTTGLTFTDGDGTSDKTMTFKGTLAAVNAALAGMTYAGAQDFNGADVLTVTTDDLGHNGAGGAQTDTDTVAITVDAVNDAPVNTLPADQSVAEDGTLTLSTGNLNRISIGDVDHEGAAEALSLSVTHGTLTLPSTTGLTFTTGDGTADATMSFTGTVAAIDAAIDGLTFTPDADFDGGSTLSVVTSDQGNTGSGGTLTDSDDLGITVDAVNDAPALTVPASPHAVAENDSTQLTLSVADVDAGSDDVVVTLDVDHGTITLATTTGLSFTSGADGTGAMTFAGTLAEVNAAMTNLTYEPAADYFGADTLSASVDDDGHSGSGGALTDSDSVTFDVQEANSAPVNSVPGTQTFDEDTTRTFSTGGSNAISVSDPDSGADDVETELTATHGTLTAGSTAGLTSVTGDGTGTLTLTGTAAEVTSALDGLVYAPDGDYSGSATITVVTDDLGHNGSGGAKTDTDVVNLTVSAVNDGPSLTLADTAVDVDENQSLTFSTANSNGISVADADAGASGVKMTLGVAHGTLTLGGTSGITFVDSTSDGSGTLKFTGTVADVNTALDGLVYAPDANYDVDDTLSATVDDQGNTGSGGSLTDSDSIAIEINPSNSPPENTVPGTQTFDEDTTLAFSTGNGNAISVSDSDAGGADVRTTLTVTTGTLSIDTTGLDFSCGACAGTGTGDATMTFEGTLAETNAALQTLTYAPAANDTGSETLTITSNDLGNTGPPGAQTDTDNVALSITAVNDAPVNTVPGAQSVDEDTNLVFSGGNGNGLSVADVDAGSNDVRVTLAGTNGVVTLGGTTGLTFTAGDGTSDATMTFDGTVAEVNTALTGLVFRGDQNYFGSAQLSLTTSDQGNTGTGGTLSDTDNVAITVNPVNDAPVADDETFDAAKSAIGNTALVANDADDGAPSVTHPKKSISGDILDGDTDADVADAGSLTVTPGTFPTSDGGDVTIESDGDFTFHPAASSSCSDHEDFFDYTVEDNSALGELTDTGRVTIAIAGCVWYVNNSSLGNSGTSRAPFDTLAQAETASGANHTVFVFDGDDTSVGYGGDGYQMNSGERLIGEHEGLQVDPDQGGALGTDTLHPANAGAHPTLTATAADVISLDDGNEIRGFVLDPSGTGGGIAGGTGDTGGGTIDDVSVVDNGTAGTQPALELDSTTGTFNVSNFVSNSPLGVKLHNTTTPANAVSAVFNPASQISVTATAGPALDVDGTSGVPVALGTSTFDDLTSSGSSTGGVDVTNATGTIGLGDGTGTDLSLTTTSGATPALRLQNAGTVTVDAAGTDNVSATGGPAVDVTATSGPTIDLDDADSTNSAGDGVNLDALGSGTFSAGSGSTIGGAAGIGFDLNGGTGSITFAGALNNGEGSTAEITGRTAGTVTLSGPISEAGDSDVSSGENGGITLSGNTGGSTVVSHATKTFNMGEDNAIAMTSSDGHTLTLSGGTLDVDTTSGNGVSATTSGTLNVTGTGNTIDTGSGRALNVTDTDVGPGAPLTFQRISANGAASGIQLSNTGSNDALTVAGAGGTCTNANTSGCSGGRIQDTTGADSDTSATPNGTGIVLNNTRGVSLTRMHLNDHANYGIRGSNVTNFTFANSVVNGSNGTNVNGDFNESSILFDNPTSGGAGLTGSASFTNSHVQGGLANNVWIKNESGTLNRATFDAMTIGTTNGDGIMVEGIGTSTNNVTVQNSTFTAAAGDLFQMIGSGSGGSDLDFTSNAMSNSHPSIATGGGGVTITGGAGTGGHFDVDITGTNTFRDSHTHALTLQKSAGAGSMNATVTGAQIGLAGTANSGSLEGSGIAFHVQSNGVNPVNATATISNNQIRQYNNYGIDMQAGTGVGGSGNVNLTVTGNTIANPGTNGAIGNIFQGIHLNSGVVASDSYLTCALISGNTASNSGRNGGHDLRVRARQSTTVRLPGYAGGATDTTAVANYLLAQNTAVTASASTPDPGSGGYVGGAACAQ